MQANASPRSRYRDLIERDHKLGFAVPSAESILSVCERYFGLEPGATRRNGKRSAEIIQARHIAMFLIVERWNYSTIRIGALMGGLDHTTIRHGVGRVKQLMENEDPCLEWELKEINTILDAWKDDLLEGK